MNKTSRTSSLVAAAAKPPKKILSGTQGTLIVDAYSGHNVVAQVSKRRRAACHAHLRRYFHEALPTAPIAQHAIDLILGIYPVEHDAKADEITTRSSTCAFAANAPDRSENTSRLAARAEAATPAKEPDLDRNPLRPEPVARARPFPRRRACTARQQRGSLRRVALRRKNYLFVRDVEAGMSIAGLYTLVATGEARGINPSAYLGDVIPRVQDHPKRRLDELLRGPWARARGAA